MVLLCKLLNKNKNMISRQIHYL